MPLIRKLQVLVTSCIIIRAVDSTFFPFDRLYDRILAPFCYAAAESDLTKINQKIGIFRKKKMPVARSVIASAQTDRPTNRPTDPIDLWFSLRLCSERKQGGVRFFKQQTNRRPTAAAAGARLTLYSLRRDFYLQEFFVSFLLDFLF